jgi:protein phosphatase
VTTVPIPDPSLVLLVGAAGSGKSTFAARHFAPDEVLSSDAFRALLAGDEANQAVSRAAFAILHRELERRLRERRLTVVDATNAEPHHRRSLVRRADAAGVPAVALVLALPDAVVLDRNRRRPRRVDEAVIRTHLASVELALRPGGLETEGYAGIWIARLPEQVDGVAIDRVSPQPPSR